MTYRLQNLMLAMLLALTTLFVGFGTLSQNPMSGGYQLFERAASGHQANIQLVLLGNFAPPPETASECCNAPNTGTGPIAISADVKTWNQFQSATKGQFVSRADAAKGWDLYKQANGIQTGAVRSQAAKSFFLKQLGASGKAPKWMNQYLAKGKVPPGHHVDHLTPISVGGADSPINMRLKDIATHVTRHKYYRPWE